MDYQILAELLFPNVKTTADEIEARYPARSLPEGAKVTRFAPSPTGFVHFGGMYQAVVDRMLAHQCGGVFFLRIEDTDGQREVDGAVEALIRTLKQYGMAYDEGVVMTPDGSIGERGDYGPYKQSQRAESTRYMRKTCVGGKAYPCFTTEDELEQIRRPIRKSEIQNTNWHIAAEQKREAICGRQFTLEDVKAHLANGDPFFIRILADGDPDKKTKFTDLVKGTLEVPENDEDFVLLKSDGIPTYHFAHAIDDHLMKTTHVVRVEDWLPSLPKHIQLFRYLGFRMPKYLHTAQILKMDENGGEKERFPRRDMGAKMDDSPVSAMRPRSSGNIASFLIQFRECDSDPDVVARDYRSASKKWRCPAAFPISISSTTSPATISRMSGRGLRTGARLGEGFRSRFRGKLSADSALPNLFSLIGRRPEAAQGYHALERRQGIHGLLLPTIISP